MKKKILIAVISLTVLLAVLFIPIPKGALDDGGTREYVALTYKIIDWNRVSTDGTYEKTRIYFGKDRNLSIDELWVREEREIERSFVAIIREINGMTFSVEPLEGEWERYSSDRISIFIGYLDDIGAQVGSKVEVTYKGGIMESYPAQVNAVGWRLLKNSDVAYVGEWLDKSTAEKYDTDIFSDIIITEIYSDCFFARTVLPMPYTIKLNGVLSDEWCIGDQVICEYENTYYDAKNNRVECDFTSIEASDFEPDPNMTYKPVLYLYPEEETEVSVKLTTDGPFVCTYPAYEEGWSVVASPDGTLTDASGQIYNYLYWEAETYAEYDFSEGFCVKGEDTARFLEWSLEKLGLTRREANEFIVYWLPLMEDNPYNVIAFQTDAYTDSATLDIAPAPDTLIRVFMAWQTSDVYVEIPEQQLTAPEREGFTVVEWGGSKVG